MRKKIQSFSGIFGDHEAPFKRYFLHHEPLQTRSALYNYEITEHLHTQLVQIFLITSGSGLLFSLQKKIPLETPCALVIPNNVMHGFVFSSEVNGEVFTVTAERFEQYMKENPTLFTNFRQLQYLSLDSGTASFIELLDLKSKILRELTTADQATELQLSLLLQMLLINLYRSRKENQTEIIVTDDHTLKHFHNFMQLLKQKFHTQKSVRYYASQLSITPVHLNRICKAVEKKTALRVIHDQSVREAKKYLNGTTYTIAEVAHILGFSNPAHFSRFFKKLVGVSPRDFRKECEGTPKSNKVDLRT